MFNAMTKGEHYMLAIETVFFNSIFQMWYLFLKFIFIFMNKRQNILSTKRIQPKPP